MEPLNMNNGFETREDLDFNQSARTSFQFLINDYGFKLVKSELTMIRYETDLLFVNIYHGRSSYELGFECGLKSKGEESRYRLPTIIKGLLGNAQNIQTSHQASNKEAIINGLRKIANMVRENCNSILKAEDIAFTQIEKAALAEGRELSYKYTIEPIKEKAEQAWKDKDFKKVINLYNSIKNNLTDLEIKRLKYAYKKCNG